MPLPQQKPYQKVSSQAKFNTTRKPISSAASRFFG
jgi:hypothetical protein